MPDTHLAQLARAAVAEALDRLTDFQPNRIAYTIREAAELVGLPRSTLDDARSRGEFRAVKRCSKWLVTRTELLRWLDDRQS